MRCSTARQRPPRRAISSACWQRTRRPATEFEELTGLFDALALAARLSARRPGRRRYGLRRTAPPTFFAATCNCGRSQKPGSDPGIIDKAPSGFRTRCQSRGRETMTQASARSGSGPHRGGHRPHRDLVARDRLPEERRQPAGTITPRSAIVAPQTSAADVKLGDPANPITQLARAARPADAAAQDAAPDAAQDAAKSQPQDSAQDAARPPPSTRAKDAGRPPRRTPPRCRLRPPPRTRPRMSR